MNSILKTFTKSQLIDIINDGLSSEISKHEIARKKNARIDAVKDNASNALKAVKALRIRNPFFVKN